MSVIPPDPREMEPAPTGLWISPAFLNGSIRTRFEYASGQYHDVTRWDEEGTAPDEKGTLVDWVFAAHPDLPDLKLTWTEDRAPSEQCRYNHCVASTPFGDFRIEWKAWKDYRSYGVMFNEDYVTTTSSLADAKEASRSWFVNKVAEIFTSLA